MGIGVDRYHAVQHSPSGHPDNPEILIILIQKEGSPGIKNEIPAASTGPHNAFQSEDDSAREVHRPRYHGAAGQRPFPMSRLKSM